MCFYRMTPKGSTYIQYIEWSDDDGIIKKFDIDKPW